MGFGGFSLKPSSISIDYTFIISPDEVIVGVAKGSLGFIGPDISILNLFAVEFHNLMDIDFKDINGNHVGLDLNGVVFFLTQI